MTYQKLNTSDRYPLNYLIEYSRQRIPGYVVTHGIGDINDIHPTDEQISLIDRIDNILRDSFPDNITSKNHKIFAMETIIEDQILLQNPLPPEHTAQKIYEEYPKIGYISVDYLSRLKKASSDYLSHTPPTRRKGENYEEPKVLHEKINALEYKPLATLGHRYDYDFSKPHKLSEWRVEKNKALDTVNSILDEVCPPGYEFSPFRQGLMDAAQSADMLVKWEKREQEIAIKRKAGERDRDQLKNSLHFRKAEVFEKLAHVRQPFQDLLLNHPKPSAEDVTAIAALIKPLMESYREVSTLLVQNRDYGAHGNEIQPEEESRRRMVRHLKESLCRPKETRPIDTNAEEAKPINADVNAWAAHVYKSLGSIYAVDEDRTVSTKFYQRIKILEDIFIDRKYWVDNKTNFDQHEGLRRIASNTEWWRRNKDRFKSLASNLDNFTATWFGETRELPLAPDKRRGPAQTGSKRELEKDPDESDRRVRPRLEEHESDRRSAGQGMDPCSAASTPSSDGAGKTAVTPASTPRELGGASQHSGETEKTLAQGKIKLAAWGAAAAIGKERRSLLKTAESIAALQHQIFQIAVPEDGFPEEAANADPALAKERVSAAVEILLVNSHEFQWHGPDLIDNILNMPRGLDQVECIEKLSPVFGDLSKLTQKELLGLSKSYLNSELSTFEENVSAQKFITSIGRFLPTYKLETRYEEFTQDSMNTMMGDQRHDITHSANIEIQNELIEDLNNTNNVNRILSNFDKNDIIKTLNAVVSEIKPEEVTSRQIRTIYIYARVLRFIAQRDGLVKGRPDLDEHLKANPNSSISTDRSIGTAREREVEPDSAQSPNDERRKMLAARSNQIRRSPSCR